MAKPKLPYSQTVENDMLMGMNIKQSQKRAPNWVQLKQSKTSLGSNKNKPGRRYEQVEANLKNQLYDLSHYPFEEKKVPDFPKGD